MGFLSASASFSRYRLTEPAPDQTIRELHQRLKDHAFRDIDHTADERSWGWVSFEDMLDHRFGVAPPEKGEYAAFSLRLDTRRIPPAVLKKHYTLALNQELAKAKEEGRKFVSKERKRELRENVQLALLSRTLPIPAVFDVAWNVSSGVVLFGSTRPKVQDLFTAHFTQTFDLHLELMTPRAPGRVPARPRDRDAASGHRALVLRGLSPADTLGDSHGSLYWTNAGHPARPGVSHLALVRQRNPLQPLHRPRGPRVRALSHPTRAGAGRGRARTWRRPR